jgi:hypothetical protein
VEAYAKFANAQGEIMYIQDLLYSATKSLKLVYTEEQMQAVKALVQDSCSKRFKGSGKQHHLKKFLIMAQHAKEAAKQNNPQKNAFSATSGSLTHC